MSRTALSIDVLVFYSPVEATEGVLAAVFAAGAGAIGDYTECAWFTEGTGQFRPGVGASPAIGSVGELERVPEHRVEVTFRRGLRREVVAALRAAHPYEEPAFHVIETADVEVG
ncbi:hypothetical protein OO014_18615 [Intrasporangium calvum]|uniref:NGG1p interacting factor NIF3 n=1 Tax=Intrasporangium calvum TaxID=53358 RepID=A0ABT5GN03_9MICO|nr:hypothetical protein [Intrasporangium calvum]MDC5699265.1 hypothetical protein [Intrasporangium calvum]